GFKQAFKIYSVESPLLWFFMCMFGVLSVAAFSFAVGPDQDAVSNFTEKLVAAPLGWATILLMCLLVAVFAIGLSTMSSIFSSSLCAIRYDILPAVRTDLAPGDGPVDKAKEIEEGPASAEGKESIARRWTIGLGTGFYFCVVLGFYLFDKFPHVKFGGSAYLALLFAFYCAQLSFVPLILGPLIRRKGQPFGTVSSSWALAILGLGAVAGFGSILNYLITSEEKWLWMAVPACLGVGFIFFAFGRLSNKASESSVA